VPEALLIYPLAFGLLVMQKTYSIARSALVPSLVSGGARARDRQLASRDHAVVGGLVGGLPAVGVYKLFGAEGSLILAALVYAVGAMLSWQIPRVEREQVGPDTKLEKEELHAPSIILAAARWDCCGARVGFLTFFLAFGLRHNDEAPWVVRPRPRPQRRRRVHRQPLGAQLRKVAREEIILAGSLVLPAVGCLFAARSASLANGRRSGRCSSRPAPPRGASPSTACSSATRPTRFEGAASPGSRRRFQITWWSAL